MDEDKTTKDQDGVCILICNRKLLRRFLKRSNVGCDGAFNIVSCNPADALSYYFNKIVERM